MNGLTEHQRTVLRFIMDYYIKQGQFATIRVIADEFNAAHSNMRLTVKRLENKGYIERDWYGPPMVLRDEDGYQVVAIGRFERVGK